MCNRAIIICLVQALNRYETQALCVTNFYSSNLGWAEKPHQGHLRSCGPPATPCCFPLSFHRPDGENSPHISIISERFNRTVFTSILDVGQNTFNSHNYLVSSFWNTLVNCLSSANPVWLSTCPESPCRQIQHRHGSSIFSHPSNGGLLPNGLLLPAQFTLINTPHIPHSAASNEAIYSLRRERDSVPVCV